MMQVLLLEAVVVVVVVVVETGIRGPSTERNGSLAAARCATRAAVDLVHWGPRAMIQQGTMSARHWVVLQRSAAGAESRKVVEVRVRCPAGP